MEDPWVYDSFQCELEAYIRKQKARGLQPKVCFRKATRDPVHQARDRSGPKPPMVKQLRRIPSPCERLSLVERHIPPRSNMHHTRQRLESPHSGQKNHDHFFKRSCLLNPAQGENMDPHRAQGREDSCGLSREDDSRVHPADHQNRGRKRRHKEPEEPKRKHRRERDSHKENGGLGRPRGRADPVSAEKPRHRKKNHQDGDTTKERRRHQDKKRSGKKSLEELDLWDEAVLSNY